MEILTNMRRAIARRRADSGAAVFAAFCAVLMSAPTVAAEGDSLEYSVKAAYLYKFGIYVDWPSGTFPSPNSPLNLCIVGEDPFGATLDAAVRGQRVDDHPVVVRRLKTLAPDAGCHIAYAGSADAQRSTDAARGSGVLTVSEGGGATVINFVIKDNRVRFTIDDEAAAQNGLGISSRLLSLALNVKPRQGKEGR